jgi:hypothetical protein
MMSARASSRSPSPHQLALPRHERPSTKREPSHSLILPELREMSKRYRPDSPSDSSAKTTRISQATKPFVCELPPTCHKHPTTLGNASEMESHYSTCHAHVCSAEGCNRIFPEPRFLDLVRSSYKHPHFFSHIAHSYQHQTECHDPIAEIRKDRGERIVSGSYRCVNPFDLILSLQFVCFDVNCKSMFTTPKGRRLHLIDKHKYPSNFYFAVTNKGIGGLLSKWGEGATLLRKEYTPGKKGTGIETTDESCGEPIDEDSETGDLVLPKSEFASGYHTPKAFVAPSPTVTQTPPERFHAEVGDMGAPPPGPAPSAAIDVLADSMSSLALVPPSVHFGRGGVRGGFKQPLHTRMVTRGRGRARGRGRGGG